MIDLQERSPKILVVGDLMIDHYLWGSCERISPEAPVQVVNVKSESTMLSGAGNVINNLRALGAQVDVISVIGCCEASDELKTLLKKFKLIASILSLRKTVLLARKVEPLLPSSKSSDTIVKVLMKLA